MNEVEIFMLRGDMQKINQQIILFLVGVILIFIFVVKVGGSGSINVKYK